MSTQTIRNGQSIRLNVLPGQSVAVVAVSGTYNASIVQGAGIGVIAEAATGAIYGPYASGIVILLTASAASEIDFDVDVTPVIVSDTLVTAITDPLTGGIELSVGNKKPLVNSFGKSGPDKILTKHGRILQSLTLPVQTIGTTTATHALSNERPRFSPFTRKMTVTAATQSELRFPSISIVPDATDRAFSIDIYIEGIPDLNLVSPDHPYMSFVITNATSLGANYVQYTFDAAFMRQGWNTFKFRQADINNTKFLGNMAFGSSFAVTGTGVDWTSAIQYISVQAKNMNGYIVHIDDVRQPARAKTVLTIGFDANMEIMETLVAPLLARYGIESYTTFTGVYEEASALAGGASGPWERMKRLQDTYGWDILNHTWSHGATSVGRSQPCTLSRTSNVVTATLTSAHGVPLNSMFKGKIAAAATSDMNGIFDIYADTTTTFKYTAVGANGSDSASIRTMLSDVFEADSAENRRLLRREIEGITSVMSAGGLNRQNGAMVWPNNSVPHIDMATDICHEAGIYLARGARRGFTSVNEFGIDNPLHCGSWDMDSGTTSHTRLSGMKAKVQGAIDRGEHIWIYGHYLQVWAEAGGAIVDADAPPGINGNPAPPAGALSGVGGWWYYEMLQDLVETTIAPAIASGDVVVMSPSKLARHLSLAQN